MDRSLRIFIALFTISIMTLSAKAIATPPEQFDYMLHCQGCHLPDGRGFPARKVPDLRGHMGKFLMVKGGREFLVQVPGSAQSDLNDTDLARLLNWMLQTFSAEQVPPNYTPYTAEEVSHWRQQPLSYVSEIRQQLIEKIQQHERQF